MPVKRSRNNINIESIIESVPLDNGLIDGLLQLDHDERTAALAHVANETNVTTSAFKKARIELPSFCTAKWSEFARQFGLPEKVFDLNLDNFNTPRYHLPPSMHRTMFKNAWHWQDVYRVEHTREARGKTLDPYIVPIVALFQGRVIDKPDKSMIESKYSTRTGGEVEHEIFMIGDSLFVVELKLDGLDEKASIELFLQLLFERLRIYGLLTNLTLFKFYSYDPTANQFFFDEMIVINNKRISASSDMMDVSNKIFGVVLTAYIESLHVKKLMSQDRVKKDKKTGNRTSTDQWESALVLAEECSVKLRGPYSDLTDLEGKTNEGLNLLTRSVRSIPRLSLFTGGDDDPPTQADLEELASRVTRETHERYLSKMKL